MSFEQTSEALELKRMLRKLFNDGLSIEKLLTLSQDPFGDPEKLRQKVRQQFSQLGVDEFFEGEIVGSRPFEILAQVAFESGRALAPLPFAEELFLGKFIPAVLLDTAEALPQLPQNTRFVPCVETVLGGLSFEQSGESAEVSGLGRGIACGDAADAFVFLVPGFGLFGLTNPGEQQVRAVSNARKPLDGTVPRCDVEFRGARLSLFGSPDLERVRALHFVLVAQELCGVCERVLDLTVEYIKTRKQFGVPVGGFQAVQHKAAEMKLRFEQMESITQFATWAAENDPAQLEFAAFAALSFCAEHAPTLAEMSIQLHGGIGFTWEYGLHLFLRRAQALSLIYSFSESETDTFLSLAERQSGIAVS
ncbi:MAG: hypothetical protein KDD64_12465 [Bdellovibrionales bacterium]|nr:hypothetical protein [Bdellovibrionales bacterium]